MFYKNAVLAISSECSHLRKRRWTTNVTALQSGPPCFCMKRVKCKSTGNKRYSGCIDFFILYFAYVYVHKQQPNDRKFVSLILIDRQSNQAVHLFFANICYSIRTSCLQYTKTNPHKSLKTKIRTSNNLFRQHVRKKNWPRIIRQIHKFSA